MSTRKIAAIMRHGDYHQLAGAPSALQPFALNQNGINQAQSAGRQLAAILKEQGWRLASQIDSSNLLRAWQTANIIRTELKDHHDTTTTFNGYDALAERSVGSAANLTTEQIESIVVQDPRFPPLPRNWKSDSYFRLPLQGAESLMAAGSRVAEHLQGQMRTLDAAPDETTVKLFVGHGASFRHAAYQLGVLAFDDIAKLSMYHAQPVFLEYSAEGVWRHVLGDWKVRKHASEFTD